MVEAPRRTLIRHYWADEVRRIEMAIRCYDPCLSCATHALGQMPLTITLADPEGEELSRLQRP